MKNISGSAGNWIESSKSTQLQERNTETVDVQEEMDELLRIQSKLFTKHLKSKSKNIGDSIIVIDSAINSLKLN